ncbi:MAG: hypothetical protein K8T10_22050 [Candidatus Eremiobacteraeota bacterium]|nr:hypothetical protein [Candidatus Eremiobacteraeota bacterium]
MPTDEELIARFYECNDTAFDEILNRYFNSLSVFIANLQLSIVADSTASITFIQLYMSKKRRNNDRYDPINQPVFIMYLFRKALEKAIEIDEE